MSFNDRTRVGTFKMKEGKMAVSLGTQGMVTWHAFPISFEEINHARQVGIARSYCGDHNRPNS